MRRKAVGVMKRDFASAGDFAETEDAQVRSELARRTMEAHVREENARAEQEIACALLLREELKLRGWSYWSGARPWDFCRGSTEFRVVEIVRVPSDFDWPRLYKDVLGSRPCVLQFSRTETCSRIP
jgi:hypothetical protein